MKTSVREWIDKAEADFNAALLLRRSRKHLVRDIVCFHLQQCVEKYLKAALDEVSLPIPKTHDLERLLDLILPAQPLWEAIRPAVAALTDYAVEIRYPGHSATIEQVREMVAAVRRIRSLIRDHFGLP